MNKKGIANIYWLVMAIAVFIIVGIAWITTEYTPLEYTSETGREQAITFNSFITAEQVRNYAEESARLATFYALQKMSVDIFKTDCFNFSGLDDEEFAEMHLTGAMNKYMEAHPLENEYSDIVPTTYGRFFWKPITPVYDLNYSVSAVSTNPKKSILAIEGSSQGDTQILNSRYIFMYSINGAIKLNVTCDEYKKYRAIAEGLSSF